MKDVKMPWFAGATSWDLLYNILRANFDGTYKTGFIAPAGRQIGDGNARYLSGVTVLNIEDAGGEVVSVKYKCPEGGANELMANLVVGADGPSSFVRKIFHADSERKYAGYAAWRGTVREELVSESARPLVGEKVNFFFQRGVQILLYKIPGLKGTLAEGQRLVNIVWYCNYDEDEKKNLLTEAFGLSHNFSLGVGKIRPDIKSRQREIAISSLPPSFAEIFQKIEAPFLQAVTDSLASRNVFMNDKVLLVGDAVAGCRPHTASGASQAAIHALLLKNVFGGNASMSLEEWGVKTLEWSTFAQSASVAMGNLSQFGDHPMAADGEAA